MKSDLRLIIFLVLGAVIGSVINQIFVGLGAPDWLTRTQTVGLNPPPDPDSGLNYGPAYLDLAILRVTFGFGLELSFCTVLGLALGLYIFKKML